VVLFDALRTHRRGLWHRVRLLGGLSAVRGWPTADWPPSTGPGRSAGGYLPACRKPRKGVLVGRRTPCLSTAEPKSKAEGCDPQRADWSCVGHLSMLDGIPEPRPTTATWRSLQVRRLQPVARGSELAALLASSQGAVSGFHRPLDARRGAHTPVPRHPSPDHGEQPDGQEDPPERSLEPSRLEED